MGRRGWLSALAVVILLLVAGYSALRIYRAENVDQCFACQRPIHAHMRTVALLNGRPRVFCCPACALSEHQQENKPITVTQLTSFLTGTALSPDNAYVVKGSDVNMCAKTHEIVDVEKRPADVQYDRCAPSLLAFATKKEAQDFVREHGGEVLAFDDVALALSK